MIASRVRNRGVVHITKRRGQEQSLLGHHRKRYGEERLFLHHHERKRRQRDSNQLRTVPVIPNHKDKTVRCDRQ